MSFSISAIVAFVLGGIAFRPKEAPVIAAPKQKTPLEQMRDYMQVYANGGILSDGNGKPIYYDQRSVLCRGHAANIACVAGICHLKMGGVNEGAFSVIKFAQGKLGLNNDEMVELFSACDYPHGRSHNAAKHAVAIMDRFIAARAA